MSAGVNKLRVVYDDKQLCHNHSAWSFVPWHSLAGVRNKSIRKTAHYTDEDERPRSDEPTREELEANSRRFATKYLLAIMNSATARDFLRANRRSNIHLYPDDWKHLPIPAASESQQAAVVGIVDRILTVLRADPQADISNLEAQVERTVADMYGLKEQIELNTDHIS